MYYLGIVVVQQVVVVMFGSLVVVASLVVVTSLVVAASFEFELVVVDYVDAIYVLEYDAKLRAADELALHLCDVNGDGDDDR